MRGHPHRSRVGQLARRAELQKALLSANRAGDELVITRLDRLGRSLGDLIELSKTLEGKGVNLVVLDQSIDTSTAVGRMFFHILGAIAEFEHELIVERTMDGLAAARARGRTGGQKPKLRSRQVQLARQMYDEVGEDGKRRYTVAEVAAEFGVTRPTIYRHLGREEAAAKRVVGGRSAAGSPQMSGQPGSTRAVSADEGTSASAGGAPR